jgi:PLD-like domain
MLLTRDILLEQLDEHLKNSDRIDLAVAWATDCNALARLCEFAKNRGTLRAIVGIWGNATRPTALRSIQKCAQLRIALSIGAQFHPKFYLFHKARHRIGWIGSVNLTRAGFQQNEELIYEFSDDDGKASQRFDDLWRSVGDDEHCNRVLDKYEAGWQPPSPPPRTPKDRQFRHGMIYRIGGEVTDWASFVAAIDQADEYWSAQWNRADPVTGEASSWLNTITRGREVMQRGDWSALSRDDRDLMLGRETHQNGYGLLGGFGAALLANNVFARPTEDNFAIRENIRQALRPVMDASDVQFAEAASEFIAKLEGIRGFGGSGAIATRFLALARPDRAISVNEGSRARLSQLTRLPPESLGRARMYGDLLQWFEDQDWYSSPNPKNVREHLLKNARAALFDAFVYEQPRD